MREIEFRGKTIDTDKWVCGSLISVAYKCWIKDASDKTTNPRRLTSEDADFRCVEVLAKTVGQYTGLTDKNGTKIFEGDIVMGYAGMFKVCFVHGSFVLANIEYLNANLQLLEYLMSFVKVIGNIHDNSELMEVTA